MELNQIDIHYLIAAICVISSALVFYTIGVWGERLQRKLKFWHIIFFLLGLLADTVGTSLMEHIAELQLEEEKEKNKERIRKAYGESASNIGSKSLRKRRHIYLFNTEDLDNDDIIAMVEDSPTYMRDKTTLTKIRTKAALEEEVATEEATDDNGVITF